jgi:outer membrane protein assembly factor BamB
LYTPKVRDLMVGLILAIGSAAATGCAPVQTADSSPVGAAARAPRFAVQWREPIFASRHWEINPREYSAPVYIGGADELVTAASSGRIVKIRAHNGEVVWAKHLEGGVHGTPTVHRNHVYVGTMQGRLYALSLATGEVDWTIEMRGSIETSMAADGGRLFVVDSQDILYALDATTGQILWQYQRRSPEFFTIKGGGVPVVDGDVVYAGFADGTLAALFVDSGDEAWVADLSADRRELVDVDVAVRVEGDRIYAASYAGGMYALERRDGLILWRRPIESVADFIIDGNTVFVASAIGRVHALDRNSGEQRWQFGLSEDVPVQLAASGPYLFVSTATGPLFVFDRFAGRPVSRWQPASGFNSPVVFGGNRGYLLSNGGYLYGFRLAY